VAGSVFLRPFFTGTTVGETAGVLVEGNRIVGGENYEEFTADSAVVTESVIEPTQEKTEAEEKEEEKEEESPEAFAGPVQALSGTQLIEAPTSFPDEQPVQPSTFQTCAV
jgi:hypothetical protein